MSGALQFGGGLVVLLVAGHVLVRQATELGRGWGLSPLVIGLTIVAAGTSAPELAVFAQAILADDTELAVGSVIGSNIANVLLVLGAAAAFGTIHVAVRAVRIDIPLMIAASIGFLVFALDGKLGRVDGLVLVGVLLLYVGRALGAGRRSDARPDAGEPIARAPVASVLPRLAMLIGAIAALAVSARFVVQGAEALAIAFGLPELVIGLTVLALGTSAPEIATTLIAAVRGQRHLAIGNAVGSNIFNILLVLGVSALAAPDGIGVSPEALRLDLPILVAAALACLPLVAWDHVIERWEGMIFVLYYVAYVVFLFLDGTGHRAADRFAIVMVAFVIPLSVLTIGVLTRQRLARRREKRRGAALSRVGSPGPSWERAGGSSPRSTPRCPRHSAGRPAER